jgi:hypothetical protein
VSTIFGVYALSYATGTVGLDKTTMLWVAIVTNVVALVAIPAWAALADRIGRKPVFIFGALGSGALMFAYLAAIASGRYVLIFLAAILMSGVVYSAQNVVWPALYGEMFPTKVRLSGTAVGTQIGFAIGGASRRPRPPPSPVTARRAGCRWRPTCSPSASWPPSPWRRRETYDVPLYELDGRPEPGAPDRHRRAHAQPGRRRARVSAVSRLRRGLDSLPRSGPAIAALDV